MNTVLADTTVTATTPVRRANPRAVLLAQGAAWLGALSAVTFTAVTFAKRTPDEHAFRHAADYWYTGIGMLPAMAAALLLVLALHILQNGRDGRLGRSGAALMSATMLVYITMGTYALVIGKATSFGPTYVLNGFASFLALALFTAGSRRSHILPRSLLAVWLIAWIIGGPFGQSVTPLALAGAYSAIATVLAKRGTRRGSQ